MSSRSPRLAFVALLCAGCLGPLTARTDEKPLLSGETVKREFARRLADDRQERDALEERYRYVRTRIREERNKRGELRDRHEEEQVHDPRQESEEPADGAKAGRYKEREIVIDEEILDRFMFEVQARESFGERMALRVAFRPRTEDLPQHSTLERFINRSAGTLWLEESTLTLLKAEVGLLESVEFLAGIAGIVHRLDMTIERAATPEGLWYTRRSAWKVDYRTFLVRKIVHFEECRTDVRCVRPDAGPTRVPQ